MEIQLENGKYSVAFSDANLDVNVVESTPLNVVVGESARIEVGEAINYIKTGTSEIEEAVRKGIASFDSNAVEKTDEFNQNYNEKKQIIDAQVDIAEEQANIATSQAQTATVEASNARESASNALESEQNAKESEINALSSANSASNSADTAIAQADIATQKAEIAIEKASEAIIAANESSISANNAEIWAEGNDSQVSELGGTHSSKGWAEYAQEVVEGKQDIIHDLEEIRSNAHAGKDIIPQVNVNTQRIEDLTVARFPNVIVKGTPQIIGGQVSGFSDVNYLQFPFVDISRGYPFDIYFSFTTANDVTNQQNVLDAYFGIALAIQNGKGIMALSSNGTSWDIGTAIGTNTITPNTTYYVKYSWTGTEYNASLSQDEQSYVPDMNLASTLSPHKTTIFIGGSPNIFGAGSAHPFKGTINFNKSKVVVNGITVWEGMADVGLASRANVSLNNLDEVGEARFTNILNETGSDLDYTGTTLSLNNAKGDTLSTVTIKSSTPDLDNSTISLNASDELQAIGVIEKNKGLAKYDWVGTLEEYEAQNVETLHHEWICYITDDVDTGTDILQMIYPVGSLYLTTNATCPLANLFGTWTLVSQDRVLQGAGSRGSVGTTVDESLPNIKGSVILHGGEDASIISNVSGAFSGGGGSSTSFRSAVDLSSHSGASSLGTFDIRASRSSSTYKDNAPVQQNAYLINVFRRTA